VLTTGKGRGMPIKKTIIVIGNTALGVTQHMKITGGCYCGAVRYEVNGEPQASLQCYCRECCYLSGGNSVPLLRFSLEDFKLTCGEMKKFRRSDLEYPVTRHFCETCGTGVANETPKRPGAIILKVGTFDDPSIFKPDMVIFTRDKQDYHHVPEDILAFEGRPE